MEYPEVCGEGRALHTRPGRFRTSPNPWGIMERSVHRGLKRRADLAIEEPGIDEISFRKRHEYVTVLVDRSITMDMWEARITAVQEELEDSGKKIYFDRFHVTSHFARALDKVRVAEHRELNDGGASPLKGTRHESLRSMSKGG